MRQMIYEALGAESGATMTEYDMFAGICVDSAASAAILFGVGWESRVGIVTGRSSISSYLSKKFAI